MRTAGTFRYEKNNFKALKHLALERGQTITSLLDEGIVMVLKKYTMVDVTQIKPPRIFRVKK